MNSLRKMFAVALAMLLAICAVPSQAQAVNLTSAVGTSTLTYTQGETITVSGIPNSLTFDPTSAITQTLNVTTSWQLVSTRTRVAMNLYFAVPTAAMTDGAGHNIPASGIGANKNGG